MKRVRLLLILAFPLFAAACLFENDKTAFGGGSDTETLTGVVASGDGSVAAHTLVKLIPADYDPSHPDTTLIRHTLTDAAGLFRFDKLDKDKEYNVIAGTAARKTWAYAPGLRTGQDRKSLSLSLAKVFLFSLHSQDYIQSDSGIAFFPGTDILTRCDGISLSKVDSVPMGALRLVVQSRAGWIHDTTLAYAAVKDTAKVIATKSSLILYP